jgi:hypothetical protein
MRAKRLLHCAAMGFYFGAAIVAGFAGEAVFFLYAVLSLGHGLHWVDAVRQECLQEMRELRARLAAHGDAASDESRELELAILLQDLDHAFQQQIRLDQNRQDAIDREREKRIVEAFLTPGS